MARLLLLAAIVGMLTSSASGFSLLPCAVKASPVVNLRSARSIAEVRHKDLAGRWWRVPPTNELLPRVQTRCREILSLSLLALVQRSVVTNERHPQVSIIRDVRLVNDM